MEKTIDFSMTARIEDDLITKELHGRYRFTQRQAKLIYRQSVCEGEAPITETLTVFLDEALRPVRVRIFRPKNGFELVLEKGQSHQTLLSTPAGAFEISTETLEIAGNIDEASMDLSLRYRLILGGQSRGEALIRYHF